MFVLDRSQRARIQKFPRIVAAVVSMALLTTALEGQQSAIAVPAADPTPPVQRVDSRPDVVSAAVSARAQGSRVEVESMRTETSTTWSNPDGTMTTDAHATPIRFKNATGAWQTIDLTLQKAADGTVAPRSHQRGLRLGKRNTATGQVFASADSGAGRQVEWVSPWKLPEPMLDGPKATYAEVQPGVDLVLDAQRNGFENDFVVKQRPAAAPVWRIPLRTKGLTPKPQVDGSVQFVDSKNVAHSTIPVGYMWDAAVDPATGDSTQKTVVKVTVEQVSVGKATLVIAPDAAWFMDPARVFPVTVDPTYVTGTLKANFDTWIQSDVTTDQSASNELRVGYNGSQTARSILNFATSTFAGKDILSATLSLWQTTSLSCTASSIVARSSTPASTATRWSNKPDLGAVYGSVSAAKGFSSACPGGRISVPMTGLAQAWSTAPYPTGGLALTAGNEADPNSWKKFYSTVAIADPYVTMTWNRPPATPAIPTFVSAVAYAPPGGASAMYSPYVNPWVATKATDADGNTVKYVFEFHNSTTVSASSLKASCTSVTYASGTTAGCQPNVNLPDDTTIYVRAKANDGRRDSAWSGWSAVRVGAQQSAGPSVSCPAPYANNSWQDNPPAADVVCMVTATGTGFNAPGYIRLTVDGKQPATNFQGGAAGQIKISPSSDPSVAKTTVTIPHGVSGLHKIVAQAETPAGRISGTTTYGFGWGSLTLTSPGVSPRTTTTGTVKVEAAGPPKGQSAVPEAHVRWRVSGYGGGSSDTVGWNVDPTALPVQDNGAGGVSVSATWDSRAALVDDYLDSDPTTAGVQKTTLNTRLPVLLDVQVCLTYTSSTQCSWSETPNTTIQRVPHAFGDGFPTSDVGPGEVALWTGEFSTDATDIEVPGYAGNLTVSRSHATYAGPANAANSVFGPGWVAQFDGTDEGGAAGLEVVDSTLVDGTLALLAPDGTGLVYTTTTGARRTGASLAPGTWVPADESTELDGGKLALTGSGAGTTLTYTTSDGVVTTFKVAAAPTSAAAAVFRAVGVSEPGLTSESVYSYDGSGRITRILAPTPPGVTCAAYDATKPPLTGLNAGCRAVRFDYATVGSQGVRMTGAWLDIYNPAKAGGAAMDSIKVAAYTYDTNGRLQTVTDPRSNLATGYGYNAAGHLSSITPPGQVPYQLGYVADGDSEKLSTVTRQRPSGDATGGTATLAKIVYDVPLSGPGLPDLTAGSVARWAQKSAPAKGYAVFGPDHPLTGAPGEGDWRYAELQYADANGYTVNSAEFGPGAWQYTATDYNDQGNVTRELDERAVRLVIDDQRPAGATVDQLATLTVYNDDIKNAAGEIVTPAGTLVTDAYGPARYAALKDGTVRWARGHTHTEYDHLAPNNGINPATTLPYRLETSDKGTVQDPGTGLDLETVAGSVTEYAAISTGDTDGWAQGLQTRSITDVDLDGEASSGDQVHVTRYDTEGRPIEARQAMSADGNGNDAGTSKTVYYTAAANPSFPQCGAKPEWAGLLCRSYPGAAPVSAAGQPATPSLPTTSITGYTYLLAPTVISETSGTVTRTTTTTYLSDGRIQGSSTATTGLPNSTPTASKDTTYDPATGLITVATALNADGSTASTVTTGHDAWGRQTSYQPSGEPTTTTSYNAAGDVAQIVDSNGTTSYTYEGPDATGTAETRGLLTRVDVVAAGGTWTSTAAYDVDGTMVLQKLPGGVSQSTKVDNAGEVIGLEYNGPVTTTNEDGSTTVDPIGSWLAWSRDNDVNGRLAHEWTPDGAAFTGPADDNGPTDVGDATPYDRAYSYDAAGRLTQVKDRTGAPGTDILDPTQAACVTRTYGFDANDNRLTKATATSDATGACTTASPTTTTRAFDSADRPTTGANGQGNYVYDALGRTLTIPAADVPRPQDGNVSLTYYDNDLAKTITQGGTTTDFTLDAFDRRSVETATTGGVSTQTVRHYTDASDNPTWVTTGSTTQRYTELIGGDLSLTVAQTGAGQLTLSNQHGDIVSTVALPAANATAAGITGWNSYDEYGIPSTANSATTGAIRYGWLGAEQRATSGADLQLMGVRLYNSTTGLFTSTDPVSGGNSNDYTYPTDPINQFDTDGRLCMCSKGGGPEGWSPGGRFGGGGRAGGGQISRIRFNSRSSRANPCTCASTGGMRFSMRHLNRMMDRLERSYRGKTAQTRGRQGMDRAGVKQANQKITTKIDGRDRKFIPDFWGKRTIGEVKYYRKGKTLTATRQIRGMAQWAHQRGYKFVIRVNYGVKLSRGIRDLERQGRVIISRFR